MLYDNALLLDVLSEAYKVTQNQTYREVIEETVNFMEREWLTEEGGFHSSYDADSEGEEGKFYVWQKAELDKLLQTDAAVFNLLFSVTEAGNWEHTNILHQRLTYKEVAEKIGYEVDELKKLVRRSKKTLFDARENRVKPGLDDKIILGWNAMLTSALAHAYEATANDRYRQLAERNLNFLLEKFKVENAEAGTLYHTYKNGKAQHPAFLDDYALLIEALLNVYGISFDEQRLHQAHDFLQYTNAHFRATDGPLYFYTAHEQTDVVMRKRDSYDGATPAGNSTMAKNLVRLGILLDQPAYTQQAVDMLQAIKRTAIGHPTSFSRWATVLGYLAQTPVEIAVVGEKYKEVAAEINRHFIPHKILAAAPSESDLPLLAHKYVEGKTLIYRCQNYACQAPVETVNELLAMLVPTHDK